jgi:hypothetical protein
MNRKLTLEIYEIDNGWIVEDSFIGHSKFVKTFEEAVSFVNKIIVEYQKQELEDE